MSFLQMKRKKYIITPYIIKKDNDTNRRPKIVTPYSYVTDFDGWNWKKYTHQ